MKQESRYHPFQDKDSYQRDLVDKLFGRKTQTEIIEEAAEKAAQRILESLNSSNESEIKQSVKS